jgi:vacuolar iron transporter family protein
MTLPNGKEQHFAGRSPWIHAGVLGANDGLVSTASLVVGVAAADVSRTAKVVITRNFLGAEAWKR